MFAVPSWETDANTLKVDFAKSKTKHKNTVKNKKPQRDNDKKCLEGKVIKAKDKVQNVDKASTNKFKNIKRTKKEYNKINKNPKFLDNEPKNRENKSNFASQQRVNLSKQNITNIHNKSRKRIGKKSRQKQNNRTNSIQKREIYKHNAEPTTSFQIPGSNSANTCDSEEKEAQETKEQPIEDNNTYNDEISSVNKKEKQNKIRKMLQMGQMVTSNVTNTNSNKLRIRMLERLKAAQFRYLNEKLYTTDGSQAKQLFQSDPESFHTYHEGYQQQLRKWPVKPLDIIAKKISQMPTTLKIADMGCGEAALAKQLAHSVRSFDLVSSQNDVESCDMAHTPLLAQSMDVVVYCLALMGTTLTEYLLEANRVLKTGGLIMIAEVESRFDDVDKFIKDVERLGFKNTNLDNTHKVFYFLEFKKVTNPPSKRSRLPMITLRPCLYKRR